MEQANTPKQPKPKHASKSRKTLQGFVISTKMMKTIVVEVERKIKHPLYKKFMISHKKYHVHDEKEVCKVGDFVEICETRPLSAQKRWRLNKVVLEAK